MLSLTGLIAWSALHTGELTVILQIGVFVLCLASFFDKQQLPRSHLAQA